MVGEPRRSVAVVAVNPLREQVWQLQVAVLLPVLLVSFPESEQEAQEQLQQQASWGRKYL